jgi:hypothetical protein
MILSKILGTVKTLFEHTLDAINDSIRAYDDDYNYAVIKTATTTTIKNTAGYIKEIRVVGGTLGNVSAFDSLSGSGPELCPAVTPDKGQVLSGPKAFATGLTIVTAAATIVVVSYR